MNKNKSKNLIEDDLSSDELFDDDFDSLLSEFEGEKHESGGLETTHKASSGLSVKRLLSPAQEALYFIHKLNQGSTAYTIFSAFKVIGNLDNAKLQNAVLQVVQRHEALRMVFKVDDQGIVWQEPMQDISSAYEFSIIPNNQNIIKQKLSEESGYYFDLTSTLPIRIRVFQISENEYIFSFSIHHIVIDAFSIDILISDIDRIYNGEMLEPLKIQFAEFVEQKKSETSHEDYRNLVSTSANRLARIEPIDLSTDFSRPAIASSKGGVLTISIEKDVATLIYKLSQEEQSSAFMVLAAAFSATLSRFTMQEEFALGTSFIDRGDPNLKGVIGYFVSMLVLKCDLTENPSFRSLVRRFKDTTISAVNEADVSFTDVVKALRLNPDSTRHPVFQVSLSLFGEKGHKSFKIFQDCTVEQIAEQTAARFDIELLMRPNENCFIGTLIWKSDLFSKETMESFSKTFNTLLSNAVQAPDTNIELLDVAAKPLFPISNINPIHSFRLDNRFREIASRFGSKIAVEYEEDRISYQELDDWSDAIAAMLIEQGIKPNDLVGISYKRSIALIASMIGTLKAGAAYIPLDPEYPPERLLMMIKDAQLKMCLGNEAVEAINLFPESLQWNDINQLRKIKCNKKLLKDLQLSVEDNAYILFTSGSTGRPKGVMVSHKNVSRLFESTNHWFKFSDKDIWSMFHSYAFDFSVWEIFGALLYGGRLVIVPYLISRDPIAFIDLLRSRRITMLSQTPSAFKQFSSSLFEAKRIPSFQLRHIVFGGEALDLNNLRHWFQYFGDEAPQLTNMYGITETTVHVTYRPIKLKDIDQFHSSPIGIPIPDLSLRLVDKHLHDVPEGGVGEILVGGEGVAKGYLDRDDLTKARFVKVFDGNNESISYRSGDLARIGKNGELVYLRRADQQVKIRGFRIELGDIGAALSKHPDVQAAEIVVQRNLEDDDRILAYVIPKTGEEKDLTNDQLSGWVNTFDETYSEAECTLDKPDFSGWNSSYDKQEIPRGEMEIWLNETLERIKELKPHSVLEIGCGTGMILAGIAPHVERYFGFDMSKKVIEQLRKQVDEKEWSHVSLAIGSASDIFNSPSFGTSEEMYDLVIINSVAQYFPSKDYLRDTLVQAAKLVRPNGHIFIGDLRANATLDTHHLSLALFDQGNTPIALSTLKKRLLLSKDREVELLVDPGALEVMLANRNASAWPKLKDCNTNNELSRFRYDVVLKLDQIKEVIAEDAVTYYEDLQVEYEILSQILLTNPHRWLVINETINSRISNEISTLYDLEFIPIKNARYSDVTRLYQIGDELNRPCASFWRDSTLNNPESMGKICFVFAPQGTAHIDLKNLGISMPSQYSDPLALNKRLNLLSELKRYLQEQLPPHMVPSAIIALSSFPLTPTGKLDRQGLPEPEFAIQSKAAKGDIRLPQNQHEEIICQLFRELIGVQSVNIDDNFFAIGGHSLLAMKLITKIKHETKVNIPLKVLFDDPTPEAIAKYLQENDEDYSNLVIPNSGISKDGTVCLSFGQSRLWLLDQLQGPSSTYNMPQAIRLRGKLDIGSLRRALAGIYQRHQSLRTVIKKDHLGQAKGWILNPPSPEDVLRLQDLSNTSSTDLPNKLKIEIDNEISKPFILERDYSLRTLLIKIHQDEYILVLTLHHQVGDGKSMQIIASELAEHYSAFIENRPSSLRALSVQYYDWAFWQQGEVLNGLGEKVERAKKRFSTAPDCLSLPLDFQRNPDRKRTAGIVPIQISVETTKALKQIASTKKMTLFSLLIGVYGLLLYRLSGQDTVVIGTAVSGRNIHESEDLIGFLINTIAIPLTIEKNLSINSLFDLAKHEVENALADQDLPFEKVIEELNLVRSLSHTPLFQAMFAFQEDADIELRLPNLEITPEAISIPTAKTDITLHFSNVKNGQLMGAFEYDADLFEYESVVQWADILIHIIDQIALDSNASINTLTLLNNKLRKQALISSMGKNVDMAHEPANLVELFERSLHYSPNAIAILTEDTSYTYEDLNQKANALADQIRRHVSGFENTIAVFLDRSPDFIICMLAILKSGNVYLPLSREYPIERIRFMLMDSQTTLVIIDDSIDQLIHGELASILPAIQILNLSQKTNTVNNWGLDKVTVSSQYNNSSQIHSGQLAYIIYTSGSTGIPKGVAVPHFGAINMAREKTIAFDIHPNDRVLQFASLVFDGSIQEIFSAFYARATLVMPSKEMRMDTAFAIPNYINHYSITHITLPPSLLETLDLGSLELLKNLAVAGEACPLLVAKKYSNSLRMINAYGPTEASVCATISKPLDEINLNSLKCENTPIGYPIANVQTYILDQYLDLVPDGVVGELYISGIGVARGYYEKPSLTSQSFLPCPFNLDSDINESKRMYKTGDLVKRHHDGNLEFIGRVDRQIKLRGYRIELGEIEAVLANLFSNQMSQIVIYTQTILDELRIIAYYSTRDKSSPLNESEIKSKLRTKLPDYMIPSACIEVAKIPLTANGKIDFDSLPLPTINKFSSKYLEPNTPLEKLICQIYSEITGANTVGIKDNFFDLGGHSLSAIKLVSRLFSSIDKEIPVRIVFSHPSPEALANYINEGIEHKIEKAKALPLNVDGNQLPMFCIHPAGGYGTVYKHLSNALGKDQPVWALQAKGLEPGENPDSSITEMAKNYIKSILEIQPSGPFRLLGWSIGGVIAQEMAVILEELGYPISQLILLDSPAKHVITDDEPNIDVILFELIKEYSNSSQSSELNPEDIPEKFAERLILAKKILVNNGHIPEDTPLSWIERSLNQFALSVTRLNHHIFRKCDASILFFSAKDTKNGSETEWSPYTNSTIEIVKLNSIHSQMVDEKYSKIVADHITHHYENQVKNAH